MEKNFKYHINEKASQQYASYILFFFSVKMYTFLFREDIFGKDEHQ